MSCLVKRWLNAYFSVEREFQNSFDGCCQPAGNIHVLIFTQESFEKPRIHSPSKDWEWVVCLPSTVAVIEF